MSSWGRLAAALRGAVRGNRALRTAALRGAVGPAVVGSVLGTGLVCYHRCRVSQRPVSAVFAAEEQEAPTPQLSPRKMRFIQFASVVYDQEPYMTPRDFLYSIMLEKVDRKLKKRLLTAQEVNSMLRAASAAQPGTDLFRTWGDNGLISYTEYLFLLTILTKPRTGFRIAFQMLDVDGNEQVDKKEFLKLKKIIGSSKARVATAETTEDGEAVSTSLQAYFFGRKGENKLKYQEFHRFMEDLQAEVQEMEFLQFSKGMDTMRREDFAEWLLHYTNEEDNEIYWENMRKKIPAGQSITFDEFKAFCLFSNNLEDFVFSMKMVTGANRPVGMAQFRRAVKIATGHELSESVLDTVFKLFDMDGDNCLSHKEFMGVMTDRVLRGLKVQPQSGISGYWKCVKRETLTGAKEALGNGWCPI
ncbi:hypothetical protein OJAV_G00145030 [Oryzias javanicus]|uniref:EF-hand domain-containing protein n=1 Tax=Oryzias javanicus TaxID=123683 RepID=A0A3S2PY66_ORYJA|nr:hypothetical protein OJAV_G00145030 [Oryzias javanicus]